MPSLSERLTAAFAGRYRMVRELGRGGMATVYLADDVKHERQVAVKVLHPELTAVLGPERFLQEIRIVAKLSHPHILPLHDSGQADTFLYYVMPYVEGESLRERLSRETQLPMEDAVRLARQTAAALHYAHRHEIIHRDIKPENILLLEGEAVVADFGIALAVAAAGGERITETGLSLGTPEYMSPEQATGDRHLDARSDIYSLGVVLFEMLAGQAPFTGPTAQAIVAKVLTDRAADVRALRDTVPDPLARALSRALAKLAADRFATAAEFADALARAIPSVSGALVPAARPTAVVRAMRAVPWARALPWSLAAAGLLVALWSALRTPPATPATSIRLQISLPADQRLVGGPSAPVAVSPDGLRIVYAARRAGLVQLYLRELDNFDTRPIAGTNGAIAPFFSPDGTWVAFFAEGHLKKVPVGGGTPLTIAAAPWSASFGFAASWARDGTIIFAPGVGTGLFRVSADGGTAETLTLPDAEEGEVGHGWPHVLEGREEVLFTVARRDGRHIAILSLRTGEWRIVLRGNTQLTGAQYAPTGHLVYAEAGALIAAPLDGSRTGTAGSPIAVVDSVYTFGLGLPYYVIAESGALIYSPGTAVAAENKLLWVDRAGREAPLAAHRGTYLSPRLSPDGTRVAVSVREGGERDIWIYEVRTGRRIRLTDQGDNTDPVWTPDGRRITFSSNRAGPFNLYWIRADGSDEAAALLSRGEQQYPHSWTPDGRTLGYYELSATAARDIWLLTLDGDSVVTTPVHTTTFNERSPTFSPDGRWLAYVSDESGRDEVYVSPFPGLDAKWAVSTDGGREPVWAADGRRLAYRHGDRMIVVAVEATPAFRAGQPQVLFEGRYDAVPMSSGSLNYDAVGDLERFVMIQSDEESVPQRFHVVLNWFDELRRLSPAAGR